MKIEHISSKDNAILKKIRKTSRGNTEYFVLENEKLIKEAFCQGLQAEVLVISLDNQERYKDLLKIADSDGCRIITLGEKLFTGISSTVAHQGCIALFKQRFLPSEEFSLKGLFVVCDAIQDPGNMGTIIRSALGFSAAGIILLPGCANPFNAKTIRASAGACLQLKIQKMDYQEFGKFVKMNKVKTYALDANADVDVDKEKFPGSVAIVVGNEGAGISEEVKPIVNAGLKIPMDERLESLNAAVSASLVLYEIAVRKK